MLLAMLNYITDSGKTAFTSLCSAAITVTSNIHILQATASFVAIIAGVVAIINAFFPLRSFYDAYKKKHEK